MRRLLIASGLASGLLTLGACATLGEPVTLTMAEMDQRCAQRGGMLQPTGAQTGRAQADYICQEAMARTDSAGRNQARTDLDRAIGAGLQRGGPYGRSN
ncbi:MAG: hypothetical protein KKC29_03095 [Alphaproteobacteria bacterium]|jgi:hypothetical protein|nr:hypothetical protein [Alphaproteobacteria bacterium]MBU2041555.1 hypothetical protein [Alphaproteobacteria bacterium]MBU2125798.1 hypothetical protein [Alphaproteobacteria bacterium]MBU2290070.1 hypothetical protein [Alphaproteobacteria bacterium]MBU2397722.1 hypothetical protein [Alphaproteobacteria bacterium]